MIVEKTIREVFGADLDQKVWYPTTPATGGKGSKIPAWRKDDKAGLDFNACFGGIIQQNQSLGVAFKFSSSLICFDIDVKGELSASQAEFVKKAERETYVEKSMSGRGRHVFYRCADKLSLGLKPKSKINDGLDDLFVSGGFCIVTGDVTDNACHNIKELTGDELTALIISYGGTAGDGGQVLVNGGGVLPETKGKAAELVDFKKYINKFSDVSDRTELDKLKSYLAALTPWPNDRIKAEYCRYEDCKSFDNRDFWIKIICSIKDFCHKSKIAEADGLMVADSWSQSDTTGSYRNFSDVKAVWESFKPDSDGSGVSMNTLAAYASKNSTVAAIEEINNEYFYVNVPPNDSYGYLDEKGNVKLINKIAMVGRLSMRFVKIGDKRVNAFQAWNSSVDRRSYKGIEFNPEKTNDGYLNLWQGFKGSEGACTDEAFLNYVQEIICSGDEDLYNYVLDWCADLVQFPYLKQGVALVLLSEKFGTGKSFFAESLGATMGSAFYAVSNIKDLTGRFNCRLEHTLLCGIDEGVYAKNRSTQDSLKALISGGSMKYERKGQESFYAKNYSRYIFTSNNSNAIHVKKADRRFAIIEVSDKRAQDRAFFAELYRQWNNGGSSCFLERMRRRDIRKLDLCKSRVMTQATKDQKLESLNANEEWVLKFAEYGIDEGYANLEDITKRPAPAGCSWVNRIDVIEDYKRYGNEAKLRNPMGERKLKKFIAKTIGHELTTHRTCNSNGVNITYWAFPDDMLEVLTEYFMI